jgi:DNA-binding CsgD family transcriptional regulator
VRRPVGMKMTSDIRNKEIALIRIKRLASSGLELQPFVQTLFELMNDGVPHNPNRVFFLGSADQPVVFCSSPETEAMVPLHEKYFGGHSSDEKDPRYRLDSHFFKNILPTRTTWTIEDLATDSFYKSEAFNAVYRPLGYRTLAWVTFTDDGSLLGAYPAWRGTDQKPFSREDFAFFRAVAPHISRGLRVAKARTTGKEHSDFLPSSLWGTGVVLIDTGGKVIALDDQARDTFAHLGRLDGLQLRSFHDRITEGLEYVRRTLAGIFGKDSISASPPVTRVFPHWSGIQLRVRGSLASGPDGRQYVTVLTERGETSSQRRHRFVVRYGLSPREAEVLELVSTGKTNYEIGMILDLSPLTVKKHFERVLDALGVETRTTAGSVVPGKSFHGVVKSRSSATTPR